MVLSRNVLKIVDGISGRHDAIRLSGKVNDLIGRLFGEGFRASTLRMTIWPEASSAQNNMAAVSAQGSTVCVLIRRLNSSCSLSIAFEVLIDFHWLCGNRVKVNSLSPASSRLSATARHLSLPFADERLAPRFNLLLRFGVDHIPVVVGDFLMQPFRRMGQKVAMFVNRAALNGDIRPQGRQGFFKPRRAVDDDELGVRLSAISAPTAPV